MKRIAIIICAVLGLTLSAGKSQASWGYLGYSGYQPWWNIFAKRYKCLTPEEERLQKFWHDYYDALMHFYKALDHIDWVAYYKNHGYQINGACGGGGVGGCCGRINYAPVFVSPTLQWAVPSCASCGPPAGPGYGACGPNGCGPMGPGPMYAGGPPMGDYAGPAGPGGYPGHLAGGMNGGPAMAGAPQGPMPMGGSPVSMPYPGVH
jgi:hypothetical protein